ncbi:MAG TPA: methylated-DNA--[protein]-cysteine S-methyltransferase [Candidatus Brocadiaceae bacterium]
MQIKVQKNSLETIFFGSFCTSIGDVYVAKSTLGICRISFPHVTAESFLLPFQKGANLIVQRNDPALHYEISLLKEYFDGKQVNFDFPLDLSGGTPFQVKVWEKLREIPYGECRTYKWVAERIGSPLAVRAVGMANNKNPLPPVVPCHRVIGSDGSLTGYASGVHIKKWLIEMEYNAKMKYV